jgi:hypothetical protein
MTSLIKSAIQHLWPRKPEQPTVPVPTQQQLNTWHYSQGPRPGTEYPKQL